MPIGARSRSGCAACKSQRLKCNETWPSCGRCTRLGIDCSGPILRVRWSQKHQTSRDDKRTTRAKQAVQLSTTTTSSDFPEQSEPELLDSSFLSLPDNLTANANQVPSLRRDGHGDNDWVDKTFGDMMPDLMPFDFIPIATPPSVQTPELLQLTDSFSPRPETAQPPDGGGESSISPAASSNIFEPLDTNQRQIAEISQHSIIDRPLNNCDTILIEYYFKDTAAILALFDGEMNPFRSTVSRVWASSELIYFTLQSMAASYLANVYPQLLRTAIYFRQKAINLLDCLDDSAIHEQELMALFMIGGTASWFDVNDTGAKYFPRLKQRVKSLKMRDPMLPTGKSIVFFENTLACWEMFLAFVVDDDESGSLNSRIEGPEPEIRSILPMVQIPHPLTGVSHEIHTYLAKVGRLVRKNRRRAISKHFHTRESILEVHREMDEAAELEAALTNLPIPMESAIVQTGDSQTPTWHLTTLAEVYRLVGLLQLYQAFPDTLVSRINCEPANTSSAHQAEERLRQLTFQTVDTFRSIPAESGTKDFHPFLIVAVCSGLTIPIIQTSISIQSQTQILENSLSLVAADVHRARGFLRSRLQLLLHSLPKNPIQRCTDIVEATWAAADNRNASSQSRPVYWMDIMMQNSWETFMA